MQTIIDLTVPPFTFILLAAVGLDLTREDFARVRRQRALLVTGLVGPLLLLPPIAVGLVWVFQAAPETAAGLFLVAACPIGGISNAFSSLARASTALSVTLTGLSCLLAAVTIPFVGRGLEMAVSRPLDLAPPVPLLLLQLLLLLALPVGLGMWVRRRRADLAVRYRPAIQRLVFVGVGLVLTLIIVDDPRAFAIALPDTVPLAAAFVACSVAVGWLTASMVTADHRDRFTLAAEFGTRNLGVAMGVGVTLLGRVEFARFAYTYFLIELPLMLMVIALYRRRHRCAGVSSAA